MNTKSFYIFLLTLLSGIEICAQTGTITNIQVTPKHDGSGMVEVQYDLEGQNAYNLSLEVSFDGGNIYTPVPRAHLSGDISQQTSATNKLLVWDGLASFPDVYSEETSLKIIALETGQNDWPTDTETQVIEVTNPETGQTWMDRNLGASRAAISSTDEEAYGDLYQWGRAADGHEKRNSNTTSTLSSSDTPGHGDFITAGSGSDYDWRSPQNDNLWQGVNGTNNPCPEGFRLPTEAEWVAERQSWSSDNAAGAFASPLKLPLVGFRLNGFGSFESVGSYGYYWSSTADGPYSPYLAFGSSSADMGSGGRRASGVSVRCLKDATNATTLTVTTTAITDIAQTTATGGGNVYNAGEAEVTTRGVVYSTSETPTVETNEGITTNGTGTGEFTSSLTGLNAGTTYYVRAYATNSEGTSYGQKVDFKTLQPDGNGENGIKHGDFGITELTYKDDSDWEQIVQDVFGSAYRIADWSDLKSYYSNGGDLLSLYDSLGLTEYGNSAYVTRNGDRSYSSTRYYFASRHEHNKPGSYLAHDNIDNYLISLGSWYGSNNIMVIKK